MSRSRSFASVRNAWFLALFAALALSGFSAAAAAPAIRNPNPPVDVCLPGACQTVPPPPLCVDGCLKNPVPFGGGNAADGVTDYHAGVALEWTDGTLDGPCTDPSHTNCIPNVPVFHLSFDTPKASTPVVTLGTAAPGNEGYFPATVPTTPLPVETRPATFHDWSLYPMQAEYQLFSNWSDHWPPPPVTRNLWSQSWAVVIAYDPNNHNAPPKDFPLS